MKITTAQLGTALHPAPSTHPKQPAIPAEAGDTVSLGERWRNAGFGAAKAAAAVAVTGLTAALAAATGNPHLVGAGIAASTALGAGAGYLGMVPGTDPGDRMLTGAAVGIISGFLGTGAGLAATAAESVWPGVALLGTATGLAAFQAANTGWRGGWNNTPDIG
ncbi:MAG: hypothetical protein HY319_25285 [Armatimonadetes bacterium]|nr:hypothetical protein [Armatimonadota bacterium]